MDVGGAEQVEVLEAVDQLGLDQRVWTGVEHPARQHTAGTQHRHRRPRTYTHTHTLMMKTSVY